MSHVTSWHIPGSGGEKIYGNCHLPTGIPLGVVLIAHGFKGYKDYGMFPRIAQAMAAAGFIAHRFNFSHSGMTENLETFEREDLFEQDTWNKQVADYRCVVDAVASSHLDGAGIKYVMFGHSRGGVSALLSAGRFAEDAAMIQPAGVATAAAPDKCNNFTPEMTEQIQEQGYLESPSSRTGQTLRVGQGFLDEQINDPQGHDLLALVKKITCPLLVIHGDEDPTVPVSCAEAISEAAGDRATLKVIKGANHVFNTPNPMPADQPPGDQLQALLDSLSAFASRCCQ